MSTTRADLPKTMQSVVCHGPQDYRLEERINFAIDQLEKHGNDIKPVSLGVNTAENEYFPSLTVDGMRLVFTRQERKRGKTGSLGQEDLYES